MVPDKSNGVFGTPGIGLTQTIGERERGNVHKMINKSSTRGDQEGRRVKEAPKNEVEIGAGSGVKLQVGSREYTVDGEHNAQPKNG